MYVLGLNTGVHDSSAALLRDGALCQLVEQERLSRRKHAVFQTPREAIQACLDAEGIILSSVDAIAVGWDIGSTPLRGSRRFTSEGMRAWLFPDEPPGSLPPLRWVSHHLAHAASAYYSGGADRAAVIVVDGAGETHLLRVVALPLMGPGMVTIFLFQFVAIWNNFLLPFIMLADDGKFPLTVGLYTLLVTGANQPALYNLVITGSMLSIIPLIALFLTMQRYWRTDLGDGSVKS